MCMHVRMREEGREVVTFTQPFSSSRIFDGFKSQYIIPFECKYLVSNTKHIRVIQLNGEKMNKETGKRIGKGGKRFHNIHQSFD